MSANNRTTSSSPRIKREIDEEIKKQSRSEFFSPMSIMGLLWILLVFVLPYVLTWFGMQDSFLNSVEFDGMVSLLFIVVVALTVADKAHEKLKLNGR